MNFRSACLVLCCFVLTAFLALTSTAGAAGGAQLAAVEFAPTGGSYRTAIRLRDADGRPAGIVLEAGIEKIGTPDPFKGISWFPDGRRLVYTGVTGPPGSGAYTTLFAVPAADGVPEPLQGTTNGRAPVVSPDGSTLAFAREHLHIRGGFQEKVTYLSLSVWTLDLATGETRQLTPWRDGLREMPSSFSPDGTTLLVTRVRSRVDPELVALPVAGGRPRVLARSSAEGAYSPEGSRIAFIRIRRTDIDAPNSAVKATASDIYLMDVGGGHVRRLTRSGTHMILTPGWDPSGSRIAYTWSGDLHSAASFEGIGARTVEINADGSCTKTLPLRGPGRGVFAPVWRPGPGRGAGPLAC